MKGKILVVAAAIIADGDRILIAKRKDDPVIEPGKWEFPGGKIEPGETPEGCLHREIKEELDVEIEIKRLFLVDLHTYPVKEDTYHIILISYSAEISKGEPKCIGCAELKWIRKEELGKFDFVSGDRELIRKLTI